MAKTKTSEMVERIRKLVPNGTDYGIHKALGISQSDVPEVLAGDKLIGNAACYKLAALLKMEPAEVIAIVESERAERAGKAELAQWWKEQARQIAGKVKRGAAAMMIGITAFLGFSTPQPARAVSLDAPTMDIMLRRRWIRLAA